MLLALSFGLAAGVASARSLDKLEFSALSGGVAQLSLNFSEAVGDIDSFATDNPSRLVLDIPATQVGLKQKRYNYDSGTVRSIRVIETGERSRIVVGLVRNLPYAIVQDGNKVIVSINTSTSLGGSKRQSAMAAAPMRAVMGKKSENLIENIDFKRGPQGVGKIIVRLSNPSIPIDMRQKGQKIVIDFANARMPASLEQRLDVSDFATPVMTIDSFTTDVGSRIVINPSGTYEHLSYQADNIYTVDVKFLTERQSEKRKKEKFGYVGEKLSLNFQNIEVRAVLQLIADFTGLNVVASDSVEGNITLRLKNVPWDQALDIILKTRGLGMRKTGNVVLIAPNQELTERERQELEAKKQKEELVPVRTDFFQINYAKASDIAALLKGEQNSLLSTRGSVSIDERTNLLMVLDTDDKLQEIGRLIEKLDVPVRQVLIETRIVIANDNFSREIGSRFGINTFNFDGAQRTISSGSGEGTQQTWNSYKTNNDGTFDVGPLSDRLNVNLPVINPAGRVAVALLGNNYLIDLELSAMQKEGEGEVISNPRVVTSNQKEAMIEQGVEIPYAEASSSGATSVSFKKAVLSLLVTPQITPDDRIIMDLQVNKDSVGTIYSGVPSIDTREVKTQVLVNNGQTVVLGGIYEQEWYDEEDKVPVLGDIPILGYLFKQRRKKDEKKELLVFVTPKILKDGLLTQFE